MSFLYYIWLHCPSIAQMLSRSGRNEDLCLVADLREKVSILSPLSVMLGIRFGQMPFIWLVGSHLFCSFVYYGCMLNFVSSFSFFFFFKTTYLTEKEREQGRGSDRQREREKQGPHWAGNPTWGSIPGPRDYDLSQRQMITDWATQAPLNAFSVTLLRWSGGFCCFFY